MSTKPLKELIAEWENDPVKKEELKKARLRWEQYKKDNPNWIEDIVVEDITDKFIKE